MNKRERKEQVSLPSCSHLDCRESDFVRNGIYRGRPRYCSRSCKAYFGETQGTPMYRLKTPVNEVAQALLIVMREGSLPAGRGRTLELPGPRPGQALRDGQRHRPVEREAHRASGDHYHGVNPPVPPLVTP
jgi:hypothetical protein